MKFSINNLNYEQLNVATGALQMFERTALLNADNNPADEPPTTVVAPDVQPAALDTDATGRPWDERIHAKTKNP